MRNRIAIDVTEEHGAALDQLAAMTGSASRAEVIRDALEAYDLLVHRVVDGDRVFVGNDSQTREVLIAPFERARRISQRGEDRKVAAASRKKRPSATPATGRPITNPNLENNG